MAHGAAIAKGPVCKKAVTRAKRMLKKQEMQREAAMRANKETDSLSEALKSLHAQISSNKARGDKWRDITATLNKAGIDVAEKTVRVRWSENEKARIMAEKEKAERKAMRSASAKPPAAEQG